MKNKIVVTVGIFALMITGSMNAQKMSHLDQTKPIEERIDLLMQQMTLEEKVGQMNQYNGFWEVTDQRLKEVMQQRNTSILCKGWVGSMLTVRGVKEVKRCKK